jgi:hypothetical protein
VRYGALGACREARAGGGERGPGAQKAVGGEAEEVGKLRRILKYLFGYGVGVPYVLRDADLRWRWSIKYQEWVPTGEPLPM